MPPIEHPGGGDTAFPGATHALSSTPATNEWLAVTPLGASRSACARISVAGQVGSRAAVAVGPYIFNHFAGRCGWSGACSSRFRYEESKFRGDAGHRAPTLSVSQ